MVSKDRRSESTRGNRARHGGRVVLSLDVDPSVRDALRDRAAAAGVSMAEYLANALAQPERSYDTAAANTAQPLAQVSYRLAQATQALDRADADAASEEIAAARRIVAESLVALRRRHAEEVRDADQPRRGGWSG